MKKLLALSLVLMSVTVFAKVSQSKISQPSAADVINAMALANPADVAEFLKGGNVTTSIVYKAVSANEEVYTMLRQSCSTNGLSKAQCIGGVEIEITLVAKISMSNRYKFGSSQIRRLR